MKQIEFITKYFSSDFTKQNDRIRMTTIFLYVQIQWIVWEYEMNIERMYIVFTIFFLFIIYLLWW